MTGSDQFHETILYLTEKQSVSSCSAQEEHATTAALAEAHRNEASVFGAEKAEFTAQVLALRGDLQVKENELALAKRRADLAESTQQLDRDEIKQSKHDAYKLQNEHAADLEYMSQLELKRKVQLEGTTSHAVCVEFNQHKDQAWQNGHLNFQRSIADAGRGNQARRREASRHHSI